MKKKAEKEKSGFPFIKVILALFLCAISIFVILGIRESIANHKNSQKLKEYSQTEGTVVDIIQEERKDNLRIAGKHRSHTYIVYTSVVEYCVDGVTYTLNGPPYQNPEVTGTKKVVYYNPQNPGDGLMEEDVSNTWYGLAVLLTFVLLFGSFILFMYRLVFGKGKPKEGKGSNIDMTS